jgi:hypothetical protein
VHSWNIFCTQTNHEQTQTHKTHHELDLGEATTFPFIIFFVSGHGGNTQMSFCPATPKLRIPKFSKLGLSQLWKPITSSENLRLRWDQMQSYSPRWDLSNGMWHATCMKINWGDSWLLMVGSQIGNLIPGLSFGHNLGFKYLNWSCKLILDIYVPRDFQWYKKKFNPMIFDLYNCPLNIRESIETPTPKVGAHLGVWGFISSHSPTHPRAWNVTPEFHFWPTPLQALAMVASPRLGLQQKMCEKKLCFWNEVCFSLQCV